MIETYLEIEYKEETHEACIEYTFDAGSSKTLHQPAEEPELEVESVTIVEGDHEIDITGKLSLEQWEALPERIYDQMLNAEMDYADSYDEGDR